MTPPDSPYSATSSEVFGCQLSTPPLKSGLPKELPPIVRARISSPSNGIANGETLRRTFSQPTSTPLSSWPDSQHLQVDERDYFDYRLKQSFTHESSQNPTERINSQDLSGREAREYSTQSGSSHLPTPSSTPSTPPLLWQDQSFQAAPIATTPFQSDSLYDHATSLRFPLTPRQQYLWEGSPGATHMNKIHHRQPHNAFAFDAPHPGYPPIYTTAMDQYIANRPDTGFLHHNIDENVFHSYETESESAKNDLPYAQLIYNALMEAPEHKLVLKEIYTWINNNTDKAKDPAFKGWQNSVRHNLSMNGAFRKVAHVDPVNKHKKGFIWVLEPSAIGKGIESTTRYRQKTVWRRSDSSEAMDPKRQKSGRKGGRAARQSAKVRRSAKLNHPRPKRGHYLEYLESDNSSSASITTPGSMSPILDLSHMSGSPYYITSTAPNSPLPTLENNGQSVADTQLLDDQTLFGISGDNGYCSSRRPTDSPDACGLPAYI